MTFIFNSTSIAYTDENLRNIYQKFLPEYKKIYKKINKYNDKNENNENNLIEDSDEEENQNQI